jgi:hypothetical protein
MPNAPLPTSPERNDLSNAAQPRSSGSRVVVAPGDVVAAGDGTAGADDAGGTTDAVVRVDVLGPPGATDEPAVGATTDEVARPEEHADTTAAPSARQASVRRSMTP